MDPSGVQAASTVTFTSDELLERSEEMRRLWRDELGADDSGARGD
jgi:hypothetical protein